MPRKMLTDEEVETEIKALSASEYVMLARREQRLKYKRRQALYTLRSLEKRGRALRAGRVFHYAQHFQFFSNHTFLSTQRNYRCEAVCGSPSTQKKGDELSTCPKTN